MIEEWKSYSRYTKTVLTIYFIFSLPLLPFFVIMIPFAWWVTQSDNKEYRRKLTLADFLSFSVAMSLFAYAIAACLHWCPPR